MAAARSVVSSDEKYQRHRRQRNGSNGVKIESAKLSEIIWHRKSASAAAARRKSENISSINDVIVIDGSGDIGVSSVRRRGGMKEISVA